MAALRQNRLMWLWLLLVVATCFSWEAVQGIAWVRDPRAGGVLVMVIAFLKVRVIMLDFMEVRHAPIAMRVVVEAWIGLVCAGVVGMFLWGAPF